MNDQHVTFPNGTCIHYKDGTHAYWTCSGAPDHKAKRPRLLGISTVAKVMETDSGGLVEWAIRDTCERLQFLAENNRLPALPTTSFHELLKSQPSHQEEKAAIGDDVHAFLESLVAGTDMTPLTGGYEAALAEWWDERKPQHPQSERFVYHPDLGMAGRYDLRAEIEGKDTIVDLKTSNWISAVAHTQVRLYDIADQVSANAKPAERLLILKVRENGTYKEIDCQVSEEAALRGVQLYRDIKGVKLTK